MRVVHCKKEPYDVYIGRPSVWGNHYSHLDGTMAELRVASRDEAIVAYENWLRKMIDEDREFVIEQYLRPIAGKTLGCWCAPKACHGDVLIKVCKELGLA